MKRVVVLLLCAAALSGLVSLAAGAFDAAGTAVQYVKYLTAGDFASAEAMHDAQMKAAANADALASIWAGLIKQVGAIQEIGSPYATTKGNLVFCYVPCRFESGIIDILVVIDGNGLVSGLRYLPHQERGEWKAPSYADAARFEEIEMTFGENDWRLQGTLTKPAGMGTYPVLVLVHGSGPNDRDVTVGPNKMFKDLAWGLASRGIAVFRYDKRTAVHGDKMDLFAITVKEEVIDDAVAAVRLVRGLPGAKGVYLLGHSLGGILAPEIALQAQVDGVVVIAGSPRPLNRIIADQLNYLTALDGTVTSDEQLLLDDFRAKDAKLEAGTLADDEMMFGMPGRYWYDLLRRDPLAAAKALNKPMLFAQGERDYQITMKDFELWRSGLSGDRFAFRTYPALNHLFMAGQGQPNPNEYQVASHVDARFVEDVAAWILQL